jgi:hypothetical protein
MSVNDETDDERKRPPNQKVVEIGKKMVRFLKHTSHNQSDLARTSGLSRTYISNALRWPNMNTSRKPNIEMIHGIIELVKQDGGNPERWLNWLILGGVDAQMPDLVLEKSGNYKVETKQAQGAGELLACQHGVECEFTAFCDKKPPTCAKLKDLPMPPVDNAELVAQVEELENQIAALRDELSGKYAELKKRVDTMEVVVKRGMGL